MLKSFKIKSVACFNPEGIEVNDLGKINIIYGANGTGKTTISNYFYNPSSDDTKNCETKFDSEQKLDFLVYNRAFIKDNFSSFSDVKGVFTLGKDAADAHTEINKQTSLRDTKNTEQSAANTSKNKLGIKQDKLETSFNDDMWGVYQKYNGDFTKVFDGLHGSKARFKEKIVEQYGLKKSELDIYGSINRDELKKMYNILYSSSAALLPPILLPKLDIIKEIDNNEKNEIFKKKIIGKSDIDFSKLINRLNSSDWVNKGMDYLAISDNICPFCQQKTITIEFKQQLEDYFNDEFNNDVKCLQDTIADYKANLNKLINDLNAVAFPEEIYKDATFENNYRSIIKEIKQKFSNNEKIMDNKLKEKSVEITVDSVKELYHEAEKNITLANEEINKYNCLINKKLDETKKLKDSVFGFIVYENVEKIKAGMKEIENNNKEIADIDASISKIKAEITDLERNISSLKANITSIEPAINNINKFLTTCGFTGFSIEKHDNEEKYRLVRKDGSLIADNLSEGEKTFVTFLYFIQLIEGSSSKSDTNNKKIIVIDDPISSLDSDTLFIVSILIRDIMYKIGTKNKTKNETYPLVQMILLTHNIYFHKEVSIGNRYNRDNLFWKLSKNSETSYITPFNKKNPIKSSYDLLWDELILVKNDPIKMNFIYIQNIMRRIVENYFRFVGMDAYDKIDAGDFSYDEKVIVRSLVKWSHDGSHCCPDDFYYSSRGDIPTYLEAFKKVFDVLGHIQHYNMMMEK